MSGVRLDRSAAWRWTAADRSAVCGGGGATVPLVAFAGRPGELTLALNSGTAAPAVALAAPGAGFLPGSVGDKLAIWLPRPGEGAGGEDRILEGSVE